MPSTNARRAAKAAETEALEHASHTAAAEIATAEASGDYVGGTPLVDDDGRLTIGLSALTEILAGMKSPNDVLGKEAAQRLKASGEMFWKAAVQMSAEDINRRSLAYQYDGRIIVRTMGRFLQSQARSLLTQAYYALRNAEREYKRWHMVDTTMRLGRQVAWHADRPGANEDGVTDAPWIDGDDRFDPTKTAADRAVVALEEALPFVAAAFIFCKRVPDLTDGEPITTKIKPTVITPPAERPQSAADRLRAAPAGDVAGFLAAAE